MRDLSCNGPPAVSPKHASVGLAALQPCICQRCGIGDALHCLHLAQATCMKQVNGIRVQWALQRKSMHVARSQRRPPAMRAHAPRPASWRILLDKPASTIDIQALLIVNQGLPWLLCWAVFSHSKGDQWLASLDRPAGQISGKQRSHCSLAGWERSHLSLHGCAAASSAPCSITASRFTAVASFMTIVPVTSWEIGWVPSRVPLCHQ